MTALRVPKTMGLNFTVNVVLVPLASWSLLSGLIIKSDLLVPSFEIARYLRGSVPVFLIVKVLASPVAVTMTLPKLVLVELVEMQ